MESKSTDNDQSSYDVFRQDSIETLDVSEEKPGVISAEAAVQKNKPGHHFKFTKGKILLALVIILLIGASFAGFKFLNKPPKKAPATAAVTTQSLDNGILNQLEPKTDGNAPQKQNNANLQGTVDIDKNLSVGGTVNIQGATNIKGSLAVGQSLSVGDSLTVRGLITAASLSVGSITISSINISGDLVFGGHIIPSGGQPAARASNAAGGGSVSVSGNDTAGTIIITTGSGGLAAGEMALITFRNAFSATPKVQLTPVSAAASDLRYFATRSTGFFTINTSAAPAANTTYAFDYLVTQ